MSFTTKLRTYAKLGVSSIARVASYRLGIKSGWHPVQRLRADVATGPFLRASERHGALPQANTTWDDAMWRFGWHRAPLPETPPNWFSNPFSDTPQPDASCDWWQIPDFGTGDIKGLWELSRFDWIVAWATKAAHGDTAALRRMNDWLTDWARRNPPYKGPNWKCGQEASIRVMHLVTAAWILDQDREPEAGLINLLISHLQRISPTISYAIGQQNNHGTSEAAALFIGGSFLARHDHRGETWARKGRRWLEERARTLIAPDGTFSQYSVVYHRVLLDSYALAEAWRRYRGLPAFSNNLRNRLQSATRWLQAMVDPLTGDVPNLGANDGARLIPLSETPYRDFRPSLQLAAALFCDARAIADEGPWDQPLKWLRQAAEVTILPTSASVTLDEGGFHSMRQGQAFGLLRYPRFRYRPSHADALHLDFWLAGQNVLRDAGTYSYASENGAWFAGTAAHNTVEFDGRDQMPRLGRFLFGAWLKSEDVGQISHSEGAVTASAGYRDRWGARHHRTVTLCDHSLICTDHLSGKARTAILRWRLAPGDWRLIGYGVTNGSVTLSLTGPATMTLRLVESRESRHYLEQTLLPVFEAKVGIPSEIVTEITY
jgi:hypothetical protein